MADRHEHGAAPSQKQLVFRRHPETGEAVEGQLRWGFIPHTALSRPAIQPIHVRAETIAEKTMFDDAYRKSRCVAEQVHAWYDSPQYEALKALRDKAGKARIFAVEGIIP